MSVRPILVVPSWLLALLFITWSLVSTAQEGTARVGVLMFSEETRKLSWYTAFVQVLADRGWVQGKNITFEYRYARGKDMQFTEAAQELATLKLDVIFAASAPALRATQLAAPTTPIVTMDYASDPIAAGYAISYSHPGKNVSGVFLDAPELAGKWVETLRSLVPRLRMINILWDPKTGPMHLDAVKRAAKSFSIQTHVKEVSTPEDLERAVVSSRGPRQAIAVLPSPLTFTRSASIAKLALENKIVTISMFRVFAEAGGAVGYGPDIGETSRRNAAQVARILEGAKVSELPIERTMKFDFVYNMNTMKALKLKVPDSLLLGAEIVGK